MKNDCSFVIDHEMILWEQQSTFNPNVPLRLLLYFNELIQHAIRTTDPNALHFSSPYRIPIPRFYVFYNGNTPRPEEEILLLSDVFERRLMPGEESASVDVRVKMININYVTGNHSLLESCKPLMEYSRLMDMIKEEKDNIGLKQAIRKAIASVTEDWRIYEAIQSAGKELDDMILAEFDEEKFAKSLFEQGKAEGIAEGIEKNSRQTVIRMIQNNCSDQLIQNIAPAYSLEEIQKLREDFRNHPENYRELLN